MKRLLLFLLFVQAAFGAVAHVADCGNAGGSSSTSITCTVTGTTTAGSIVVGQVGWFASTPPTLNSVTTNGTGDTITLYNNPTADSGFASAALFSVVVGTSTASYALTANFSATCSPSIVAIVATGGNTTLVIDGTQSINAGFKSSGTDAATASSLTTTKDGDLIASFIMDSGGGGATMTVGTGFTADTNQATTNFHESGEFETQSTHGAITATWTVASGGHFSIGVIAIPPAPSGPPPGQFPRVL